jgi:hypothetical protein
MARGSCEHCPRSPQDQGAACGRANILCHRAQLGRTKKMRPRVHCRIATPRSAIYAAFKDCETYWFRASALRAGTYARRRSITVMTDDARCHVRICERLGVSGPRAAEKHGRQPGPTSRPHYSQPRAATPDGDGGRVAGYGGEACFLESRISPPIPWTKATYSWSFQRGLG